MLQQTLFAVVNEPRRDGAVTKLWILQRGCITKRCLIASTNVAYSYMCAQLLFDKHKINQQFYVFCPGLKKTDFLMKRKLT
jgi:hypothetical protein